MACICFEKYCTLNSVGVHVYMQGTRGVHVDVPETIRQCADVEEGAVLYLEHLAFEIFKLARAYATPVSDKEISAAIVQNMALITAVYYESHGSVLNTAHKEGA